jgi:hypothetical protein
VRFVFAARTVVLLTKEKPTLSQDVAYVAYKHATRWT